MLDLQNFPCLSPSEFHAGCVALSSRLSQSSSIKATLTHEGVHSLILQRTLNAPAGALAPARTDLEEDDDEALPPKPSVWTVDYHVLLSPTYRVPVLYFGLSDPCGAPGTLEDVYEWLVAKSAREVVRGVGVVGAVSQTDHPVRGVPMWFVHPCNTARAMGEWDGRFDAERYLTVWVGVVGSAVGLFLPGDSMVS